MPNKRLYKTSEGAMLFGVCKGISEYLNIDVTIVRLLWVILGFTSIGFWLYIACYFIFFICFFFHFILMRFKNSIS